MTVHQICTPTLEIHATFSPSQNRTTWLEFEKKILERWSCQMSVIFFPPASLPGISVMSTWEDEMLCASPSSSNENKRQNIFPGIFQTFF